MLITMETTLDERTTEEFLAVYRESFAALDDKAAARQSLSDDEFRQEMQAESVLKFIAWDSTLRPVAMAFVATDLSVVPWISPAYYARRFPDHFDRGAIYYFGALLARLNHRGGAVTYELVKELSRFVAARNGIAAFDCCQFNLDVLDLPDLVGSVGDEVCEIDRQHIDTQRYYAFLTTDLREGYSTEPLPSIQALAAHAAPNGEAERFIDLVALEDAERPPGSRQHEEETAIPHDPPHNNSGRSR